MDILKLKDFLISIGQEEECFDSSSRLITKNLAKSTKKQILLLTPKCIGNENWKERLYWILNGLVDYPTCLQCSNKITKFKRKNNELPYQLYCQRKCFLSSDNRKQKLKTIWNEKTISDIELMKSKRQKTCLSRYGVEHHSKTKWFLEKQKITKQKTNPNWGGIKPNSIQFTDEEIQFQKQSRRRDTCLNKYGVDHYSKTDAYRIKFKETCKIRYGAEHSSQNLQIKDKTVQSRLQSWLPHKLEILKSAGFVPNFSLDSFTTASEKYEWIHVDCGKITYDDIDDGRFPRCYGCNPTGISIPQKEISSYVEELGIKSIFNDRTILDGKEIDIFIPEYKLGIEYHGFYWHSESKMMDTNKHHIKFKLSLAKDINLLQIYENEWRDSKDIVKSIIRNKLHLSERIFARKTDIKIIDYPTVRDFLNKNHIQGTSNSAINVGLFYNSDLMSVMTFGKNRFEKNKSWEMIRFCNKLNYSVVGGASKLLKFFIEKYNPARLVSFSDNRIGSGQLYNNLGFTNLGDSIGYSYIKNGKIYNRMKFQKHKLKNLLSIYDSEKSEYDNMKDNGYDRIWDAGQTKWILEGNKNEYT